MPQGLLETRPRNNLSLGICSTNLETLLDDARTDGCNLHSRFEYQELWVLSLDPCRPKYSVLGGGCWPIR